MTAKITPTPSYDVAIARKLASDIVQLLVAHQQHGASLILDVLVNVISGVAIDTGLEATDVCQAITVTVEQLKKQAAAQLLGRTTTEDKPA